MHQKGIGHVTQQLLSSSLTMLLLGSLLGSPLIDSIAKTQYFWTKSRDHYGISVHARSCMHMHVHVCTCTCTCMYMHVHAYSRMCTHNHACSCMFVCVHACTCIHMHAHAYTCMYMHVPACTCMCMHVHACSRMCTQARMPRDSFLIDKNRQKWQKHNTFEQPQAIIVQQILFSFF